MLFILRIKNFIKGSAICADRETEENLKKKMSKEVNQICTR